MPSSSLVKVGVEVEVGVRVGVEVGVGGGLLFRSFLTFLVGGVGWFEKLEIKLSPLRL